MFWILCSIIGCICFKFTFSKNADGSLKIEDRTIMNIIAVVITIGIACIQFGIGIDAYPALASNLSEIRALNKRVEDIRTSNYAYKKDGNFIAGSIENFQQSTNLTKYISELATKEARYSNKLKKAKIYKDVFPLYFFFYGWAISDRIDELSVLEGVEK